MKRFLGMCLTLFVAGSLLSNPNQILKTNAFSDEMRGHFAQATAILEEAIETKDIRGLVYLVKDYPLYENAGGTGAVVTYVSSGQSLVIKGVEVLGDDTKSAGFESWLEVSVVDGDVTYHGYLPRGKVATSDEDFLAWEMNYSANPMFFEPMAVLEAEDEAEVNLFPESYRDEIRALKEAHPTWSFVAHYVDDSWNTAVKGQFGVYGRSLVPDYWPAYTISGTYGQGWSVASEDTVKYYMDPRNWLTEKRVFQFEHLSYSEGYHTGEAIQSFLNGTFMQGYVPLMVEKPEHTYANILVAIGKENNVSPFHLAARIIQEQGTKGTSPLISGNYEGAGGIYKGYYNYFNIGASGKTDEEVITSGLAYAKNYAEQPWNSPYYAMHYGAKILVANYIAKGQDTVYYQKFNSATGNYGHQYMQNILAPSSESVEIYDLYADAGKLESSFVFKIPVYSGIPEENCTIPNRTDSVSIPALDGYTDSTIYIDGVAYEAQLSGGHFVTHTTNRNVKTAVMYKYNESGIPTGMAVWELSYNGTFYVAKELTGLRDLFAYDGFSVRITGDSGIRFVTSMARSTRDALVGNGVDGYKLKEMGTLALPLAYTSSYPLIYGGQYVAKGLAYGTDANGKFWNSYLSKTDTRYSFASVLTKVEVKNYKRDILFCGYAVLTKDGKDVVIHGPSKYNNIYDLSKKLIDMGRYQEGTATGDFLRKTVADYDAYMAQQEAAKMPDATVSGSDAQAGEEESVSGGDS